MNLKKSLRPSVLYYSLVFLGYVIFLFVPGFRTGVFAAALMVATVIEIGLNVIKSDKPSDFISLLNISVFAYLIYNFFSFIWILKNGFPISVYIEEFSNSILPMVFFFAAVCTFNNTKEDGINVDVFYKGFLYSFAALSVVCIILYAWAPQFYCDYLFNMSLISKADAQTVQVRMEGLTGSTHIGYLGVASMLVASKYMYEGLNKLGISDKSFKLKEMKQEEKTVFIKVLLYAFLFVFNFIVVFMANGRAAMVCALLVIIYLNFLVFVSFKFIDKKYMYIEIGAIVVLIVAMAVVTPGVAAKVWARLVSLPGAIGQRSEQWVAAINNMYGQWFGNGLGANGHKALYVEGAHVIPDGGLVKLYCEEGALGFALYVYIMLCTFRDGIKNIKECFCELGIIGTALLISIGSNVIAFQPCMPVFWFAVGAVTLYCGTWKREDKKEAIMETKIEEGRENKEKEEKK